MKDSIFAILDDIDQTARDSNHDDRPHVRDEQQLLDYESQYYASQTPGAHHLSGAVSEKGRRNPIGGPEHETSLLLPGNFKVNAQLHDRQSQNAAGLTQLTFPLSVSRHNAESEPRHTHQKIKPHNFERTTLDTGPSRLRQFDLSQYASGDSAQQQKSSSPAAGLPSSPAFKASQRKLDQQAQPLRPNQPNPSNRPAALKSNPAPEHQRSHQKAIQKSNAHSHAPQLVQGIKILSTHELPDRFRSIFTFPNFNAVQSKCFNTVYRTNDNFVLSSPTGSGKTAVFELAICRVITEFSNGQYKIIYQAPTKSLCAERHRDWQKKFSRFDLQCAELTGDTDQAQLNNVKNASVIITTPEKWDSVTRKWKDHIKLMQMVKLFLIDEVHMLKEDRGATLEAVVSRMKSIGSEVRFIALSATVPNLGDIAVWLGKNSLNQHDPATRERFGEDFRPVLLQKHVVGYQGSNNDYAFENTLDARLPAVITKYSHRKPIIIFCLTRKACEQAAHLLANWWSTNGPKDRYWEAPRKLVSVTNSRLRGCVSAGVAFHHAGLQHGDRLAVEHGFLNGDVNVICCTSTLAVGVNLPCHLVIIKNTVTYAQDGIKEYSDIEIMQMLGRAGRPQYDNSAVAVIMTKQEKINKYEKMVSGQEVLESCLHQHLIDHLNAEIGLGTITDLSSAKKWLSGTFLHVRLRENPEYYRLQAASGSSLDDQLECICNRDISLLREHDLVKGDTRITSTEFGDAMARYCVQFETATLFLALPPKTKLSEIISALAQAAEFKDLRFRVAEKSNYKDLNKSQLIRFPIPVNLDLPAHKVSLIIQSQLGAVDLPMDEKTSNNKSQYNTDVHFVFQHVHRLVRCIVDFKLCMEDSVALRNALMLCRSLGARCWDDSPLQLRQLDKIGIAGVRRLVNADIRSIEALENTEAHRIEMIIRRAPPFGLQVLDSARAFPKLRVSVQMIGRPTMKAGQGAVINVKAEIGFMNEKPPLTYQGKAVYVVFLAETSDGRKLHFARSSAKKLNKGQDIKFSANLVSPTQTITCHVMCDEFAGTLRSAALKPAIPSVAWPPHPQEEPESTSFNERPAMNSAKRRSITPRYAQSPRHGSDEFGDDEIEDADLMGAVVDNTDLDFRHIDSYSEKNSTLTKKNTAKNSRQKQASNHEDDWHPEQLENGKWVCNHNCKDKTNCKHFCCREGLDQPPKAPKKLSAKNEKQRNIPPSTQSQKKLRKGQMTLNLATSKRNAASPQSKSNLDQIDLTQEGCRPRNLSRLPEPLKRLEELHSKTQTGPSIPASSFHHQKPSYFLKAASDSHLSFLTGVEKSVDYGNINEYEDVWPDDDFPELPFSAKNRDMDVGEGKRHEIRGLDAQESQLETANSARDSGDSDSILDVAIVGLADSQDLQQSHRLYTNRYPIAGAKAIAEKAADISLTHLSETPKTPRKRSAKLWPYSDNRDRSPSASVKEISHKIPFYATSSESFTAPTSVPKVRLLTDIDEENNQSSKRRKTESAGRKENENATGRTSEAMGVDIVEGDNAIGSRSLFDGIDPWLIEEYGQYVDFI